MTPVNEAAIEWRDARKAFLALPAGSPDTRAALDRLANAEDKLMKAVNASVD